MSSGRTQEKLDEIFETFKNADKKSQAWMFKEINKELKHFCLRKTTTNTQQTKYLMF